MKFKGNLFNDKKIKDFKISVIIPTFNTGKLLNESMDSLINQTIGFEDIEVIIVDDKSDDDETINLISYYSSNYSNCKVLFLDENSGFPGYPRNLGISEASSDFVIVMDHDDSYQYNALEVLYDEITVNDADVAISNFNQVFNSGSVPFKSDFKDSKIVVSDISEEPNLLAIPAAIWTRLFRKSFLEENNIKFLEGMLCEDVYFAAFSSLKANGIVYLNDFYGYNYKIRDNDEDKSTIHIRNKKYLMAMLNGFYEVEELIKFHKMEEYSDIIFKHHLTSWLYTVVISDTSDLEKKLLFEKAFNLYKSNYVDDEYFEGRYLKLVDLILSKEFDLAIEEVHEIAKLEENMNEKLLNDLHKNQLFLNKVKNKLKNGFKNRFK